MTATGIPYLFIGLATLSLMYITLGPVVDQLNDVHNEQIQDASLAVSAERQDVWSLLILVWENIPVIIVFGFIFLFILVVTAEHSGPVY